MFRYPLGEPAKGTEGDSFDKIDWESGSKYLEITVDGVTLLPRMEMLSEAYAINADKLDGRDYDAFVSTQGDTMSGDLDMGNNAIKNIDWLNSDDGTGSGLDADLLDGRDYDAFVSTQGDKMSGGLDIDEEDTSKSYILQARRGTNYGLFVSTTGRVGIGTTNPSAKLDVAVSGSGVLIVDSGDSYNQRAYLAHSDGLGGYLRLWNDSEEDTVTIRSYEAGGAQAYFTAGNIGIGTTNPGAKLEVSAKDTDNYSLRIGTGTSQ